MAREALGFEEFIAAVGAEDREFVKEMHGVLSGGGCKLEVKEAKSGYVAAYLYNGKTLANYVFRKKGIFVRIYANHLASFPEALDALPEKLAKTVKDAPPCKRLLDPNACNPKCAMGYTFSFQGERYQKCRHNAFLFLVTEENAPAIRALLENELRACRAEE